MSDLLKAQQHFAQMVALVIRAASVNGYEVTLGHALRCENCPTGHKNSLHKRKLAIDLNLFRGEEYITDATGHKELHDLWESMGGSKMIEGDPNHYSLARNGMM